MCAISPEGKTAASISKDNSTRVWDLDSACRQYNKARATQHHVGKVTSLSVCDSALRVISAGEDGRAFIWNVFDGKLEAELEGHSAAIKWLATTKAGTLCCFLPSPPPSAVLQRCSYALLCALLPHTFFPPPAPLVRHMPATCYGGFLLCMPLTGT